MHVLQPAVQLRADPASHVQNGGDLHPARRLVRDLAAAEAALDAGEQREDRRVLLRPPELQHEGLDEVGVVGGVERGGVARGGPSTGRRGRPTDRSRGT